MKNKTNQEHRERYCEGCTYLSYFQKKNDIDPIRGTSVLEIVGKCKLHDKYITVALEVTVGTEKYEVPALAGEPTEMGEVVYIHKGIRLDECDYIDLYNYKGYFNREENREEGEIYGKIQERRG